MRSLSLLVMPLVFLCSVSAQVSSKWAVSINTSLDYAYRYLASPGREEHIKTFIQERNETEVPKAGYTFGFAVQRRVSRYFTVETGFQGSDKGFKIKTIPILFTVDQGKAFQEATAEFAYHFRAFDLPLRLIYIGKGYQHRFIATIGFIQSIPIENYSIAQIKFSDGSSKREKSKMDWQEFENNNQYLLISSGFQKTIHPRINLQFETIFRYGMNTIAKAPIYTHLWNIGLSVQCNYQFNRSADNK